MRREGAVVDIGGNPKECGVLGEERTMGKAINSIKDCQEVKEDTLQDRTPGFGNMVVIGHLDIKSSEFLDHTGHFIINLH